MRIKLLVAAGLLAISAVASTSAMAATVGTAATGSGSVGGFVMNGGQAMVDVSNGAYTSVPGDTSPESTWVWDTAANQIEQTNTFVWTFDLSGYDSSTAVLSGLWGVDNYGTASLNGSLISQIDFGFAAFEFPLAAVVGATSTPVFLAGMNELSFSVTNGFQVQTTANAGPGAFRAGVEVTAELTPVPLPAALPLLLAGLGGLGMMRRKKTS
ncbi:VPLPA-CTERM sorting domain-containing protein [Sulfitobacter sp. SK012]|uniref:VPLPA-CTERM sorting domain-containing protein n=1 Tax=Sulfitobacter sp. SK012 TaxID=1389005 RepID=UPI0013B3EBFC|nr:VPLPA-CTERM sorting domain-containing protein [Sulfitobacter sp. SK012]